MTSLTFRHRARHSRRIFAGIVPGFAAVVLSLLVAGTVLGAGWGSPKQLSAGATSTAVDIATLDSLTAVAAYDATSSSNSLVFARRTVNGGATWAAPVNLAADGQFADLAANGTNVDLVYNTSDGRVWYRRSTNAGVSFDAALPISPSGRFNWKPAVGRGPGGVVAVAYVDAGNGDAAVRISIDGGVTFAPADILSGNADDQNVAVGVGAGVIYVAYSVSFSSIRVKRTTNNGASWGPGAVMTNNEWEGNMTIAAEGTHAYVGYSVVGSASAFSHARYRRTLDSGTTWSAPFDLAASTWSTSEPSLALVSGVLRAAFARCSPDFDICIDSRVYYRKSTNGTSWSTPQRVSQNGISDAFTPNVGAFGSIVVYIADTGSNLSAFARAKT